MPLRPKAAASFVRRRSNDTYRREKVDSGWEFKIMGSYFLVSRETSVERIA